MFGTSQLLHIMIYHYQVRLTSVKLWSIIKSLTIFHMIHIPITCFYIFLSTLEFFKVWSSDSKLKVVFQVGSLPKFSCSKFSRLKFSCCPQVGSFEVRLFQMSNLRTTTELRESDPNLEYDPQLQKFNNNIIIWSSGIFQRSVFRRSNSMFSPIRRCVLFDVQSFNVQSFVVGSLFDILSDSTFSHWHTVIRCWVLWCSVIRCSVIRCSLFRRSVGESIFSIRMTAYSHGLSACSST